MQEAIRLNPWNLNFTNEPSVKFDNLVEEKNRISRNNPEKIINMQDYMNTNITVDFFSVATDIKTFKFSYPIESNSQIKRLVIDMNYELKIEKIIKRYKIIHLVLFIISLIAIAASWIPNLINSEIAFVIKPMSIAFSLMIVLNYLARMPR